MLPVFIISGCINDERTPPQSVHEKDLSPEGAGS